MERVGIRELRQNASAVVRRVAQGETIEITDRGQPVARLVPLKAPTRVEQLIAEGKVVPPRAPADVLLGPLPKDPRPDLVPPSQILAGLRAGER